MTSRLSLLLVLVLAVGGATACAQAGAEGLPAGPDRTPAPKVATRGGELQVPLPLFPTDNWWNLDIRTWPKDDAQTTKFLNFVGANQGMHPDFGGDAETAPGIYGFPYVVVDGNQPKKTVQFYYPTQSDGVDHNTNTSFPFYPIPDEAITQTKWIEGGYPGNACPGGDKHMLIVDRTNNTLYELYDMCWDGAKWTGGSGAFYDMKTNNRRPEGWTSADAAGLAILPGLVRYDEVFGPDEIDHAFRVTLHDSDGYVYPASHDAGSNSAALPMGARLRLKSTTNISGFTPEMQKIFRAMMKYGLIMADNGTDMYISGTHDTRWNNDILNPAFGAIKASDFEVIQLGYNPSPAAPALTSVTPSSGSTAGGSAVVLKGDSFRTGATVSIGGSGAGNVVVDRSTRITATTPAHAAGPVNVVVTNPGPSGSNAVSFTYCAGAPAAPAITTPNQVVIGATGQTASVPAGATDYTWTLTGGRITAGQGTTQLTYSAGPPGTTMRLRVSQTTAGCASAAGTAPVQVDFLDTPPANGFRTFVNTLARNGITSGCGNGNFCPDSGNTRAQMAVFLLRGEHGSTYAPPAATGLFQDVPINDAFASWIEQLANEGITSGCNQSPPRYCPSDVVTRSAMAVFLLRAKHGAAYTPPSAQGLFQDVPVNDPLATWIEQLYNEGVTSGCATNPLRYCPTAAVTRAQMAVFLVRTFSLT